MKKTTGDNLGVVGKNTEALLKEMAAKVFNEKKIESAFMPATFFIATISNHDIVASDGFQLRGSEYGMWSNSLPNYCAASQFRLYDHNFAEIAAKTDQAPEVRNIQ